LSKQVTKRDASIATATESSHEIALVSAEDNDNSEKVKQLLLAVENTTTSPLPILELFVSKSAKKEYLNIIKTRLNKGQSRRLMDGLSTILGSIVSRRGYYPASMTDDLQEDDITIEKTLNQSGEIIPDEASTTCLLFMQLSATILSSYIESLINQRGSRKSQLKDVNSASNDSHQTKKEILHKKSKREYKISNEAFQLMEILHDSLSSLQKCGHEGRQTQTCIIFSCETWWNGNFQHKELLTTQWIPLMISRTLDIDAKQADLKRLWSVKETLSLFDYNDASSEYIKTLILRTVSCPLYLKYADGQKLLSYFFQLNAAMISQLHQSARVQVPNAKKPILQAYGKIYLKAWKDAHDYKYSMNKENIDIDSSYEESQTLKSAIEENALQDLVYASIHVSSPSMIKAVHHMLTPILEQNQTGSIELLIYRLYTPILWRALNARNVSIRIKAVSILPSVFPLRNPESNESQKIASMDKCLEALNLLLKDSYPQVRAAACESAISILMIFWDAVPSESIRILLHLITAKHASDSSSALVRKSAIVNITRLLSLQSSHPVLRAILPSLGNLIHDKIEKVRLSVVRMLLKIKKTKGIKYYHVVPIDHLLARLSMERSRSDSRTNSVGSALTGLLLNSFFPQGASGSQQINRTLGFLSDAPDAAIVFYKNISSHLNINSISKLAAMLFKCLCASVDAEIQQNEESSFEDSREHNVKRKKDTDETNLTNSNNAHQQILTASNTSMMMAISRTISFLLESIGPSLSEPCNQASHDFLVQSFQGSKIAEMHAYFENQASMLKRSTNENDPIRAEDCLHSSSALLRCAGWMPPKAMESLSQHICEKLGSKSMQKGQEENTTNISAYLALLCIWGKEDYVAELLSRSISLGFDKELLISENKTNNSINTSNNQEKKTSRQKRKHHTSEVIGLEEVVLPIECALAILFDVFGGLDSACHVARKSILGSVSACKLIENALELGIEESTKIMDHNVSVLYASIHCSPLFLY